MWFMSGTTTLFETLSTLSALFSIQDWLFSWLDLIGELETYVDSFHSEGLKWNNELNNKESS